MRACVEIQPNDKLHTKITEMNNIQTKDQVTALGDSYLKANTGVQPQDFNLFS